MELENEFAVGVPVETAWELLLDLERVAPCIPGAELQQIEGEQFRGVVKVKVGPVTAQYKGVASIQQRDEANHRAVIRFDGRDTRGQGSASGTVTAELEPTDEGTHVSVHTDLKITGRVAQFGRGVLVDVSRKLLRQFADALEADVLAQAAVRETAPLDEPEANPEPRRAESGPDRPVDLLAVAGPAVIRRVVPIVLAVAALVWLLLRG